MVTHKILNYYFILLLFSGSFFACVKKENNTTSHIYGDKTEEILLSDSVLFFPAESNPEQIFGKVSVKNKTEIVSFEVNLPDNLPDNSRMFLEYNLLGAKDYSSIYCRINSGGIRGGYFIQKDTVWNFQQYEISIRELQPGKNVVRFQSPDKYDGYFHIKDLGIKILPEKELNERQLIVNQTESHSYYNEYGYVQGFIHTSENDKVILKINGRKVETNGNFFETLVKRPRKAKDTWTATVEAFFDDGEKLSNQIVFTNSSGYDFKTGQTAVSEQKKQTISPKRKISLGLGGAYLSGKEGSVKKKTELTITGLRAIDMPPVRSNMVNVTDIHAGYRFLPDGTSFDKDLIITLQYDSAKIPKGYSTADIYTYYFDENAESWIPLQRDRIDREKQIIYSRTNHFTDYINAVLKSPGSSEVAGYVPTTISGLDAAHPLTGISLISLPGANNKGTANLSYPIQIPEGRQGMAPLVSLSYNSSAGNGWLGQGWEIAFSCIEVETRWGVPWYDKESESETYLLDGETLVTKSIDQNGKETLDRPDYRKDREMRNTTDKQFYRCTEGAFQKIIRHGNSPADYWWEVTGKDGTQYFYGKKHESDNPDTNSVLADNAGNIARWNLTQIKDVFGNTIFYTYQQKTAKNGRQVFIQSINYTGFNNEKGKYTVDFTLSTNARIDTIFSARKGLLEADAWLLDNIKVRYNNEQIRAYYFGYTQQLGKKTLLQSVVEMDSLFYAKDMAAGAGGIVQKNIYERPVYYSLYTNNLHASGLQVLQHVFQYNGFSSAEMKFQSPVELDTRQDNADYKVYNRLFRLADMGGIGGSISKGWNVGGGLDVGFGYNAFLKTLSAGGNYSYSEDENTAVLALIDINGDGYPDKIFKQNSDNSLYYRLQEISPSGSSLGFSSNKVKIRNITDFNRSVSYSHHWGAEAQAAKALGFGLDKEEAVSLTDCYFADINGDGLIDIVDNITGHTYINRTGADGIPFFTDESMNDTIWIGGSCGQDYILNDIEVDEKIFEAYDMYKDILVDSYYWVEVAPCCSICTVIGTQNEECQNGCGRNCGDGCGQRIQECVQVTRSVLDWSYNPQNIYTPDIETVRCWVAPYTGTVDISGTAILTEEENEVRHLFKIYDGVRLSIQKSGDTSLLFENTLTPDNTETPAIVNNIAVNHGDILYFRLESLRKRSLDKVSWSPQIKYTSASNPYSGQSYNHILSTLNANNEANFHFSAADDFFVNREIQEIEMPFDGMIKIEAGISSLPLNEPLIFNAYKNGTVFFTKIFAADNAIDFDGVLLENAAVACEDLIWFTLESPGQVKVSSVRSFVNMYYTQSKDPVYKTVVDNISDPDHPRYLFSYFPAVSLRVNQYAKQPGVQITHSGTSQIEPDIRMRTGSTGSGGNIRMTIKDTSGRILHTGNFRVNGQGNVTSATGDTFSFSGSYFIDFYVDEQDLAGSIEILYLNLGNNQYQPGLYTQYEVSLQKFGNLYRGWGQFGYKPADAGKKYIDESLLNLDYMNVLPQDSNNITMQVDTDMEYEDQINEGFNPLSGNFFLMTPDFQRSIYVSYGNVGYLARDTMSNSHLLETVEMIKADEPPVPRISTMPKPKTVNKKTIRKSKSFFGSAKFLPVGNAKLSMNFGSGSIRVVSDFMDMNGDGYPDILSENAIQYTKPQGGLSDRIKYHRQEIINIDFSYNESESVNSDASFLLSQKQLSSNPKKAGNSLSGGLGYSTGSDYSAYSWLDINGDGLPDKVMKDGTVYFNLGYDMSSSASYNFNSIRRSKSSSYNISASGGIFQESASLPWDNFDIGNFSISGGLGGSYSENTTDFTYMDMNGDGLPDQLIQTANGYQVRLNNGNGFTEAIPWGTAVSGFENKSYNMAVNGAVTFGASMGFIPVKIMGNPKGGASWGVSSTEVLWIDMNNDGYPDMVTKGANGKIKVAYAIPQQEGLLSEIRTPVGGIIEINYGLTERSTTGSPRRNREMKELTVRKNYVDTEGYLAAYTTFEYENRNYDRYEREDYGYEKVITHIHRSRSVIERTIEECYYNDSYLFKNLIKSTRLKDNSGKIHSETFYDFQPADIKTGTYITAENALCLGSAYPVLKEETTHYYESHSTPQIITKKSYAYGAYGNITSYSNEGDVNDPGDNISSEIRYYENTGKYIVGQPKDITIRAANAITSSKTAQIDANTGQVISLNEDGKRYDFTYDSYGNIASVTSPANGNNQRMRIDYEYDKVLHCLPTRVTDIQGYSSQTVYDYKWAKPLRTTDRGGAEIHYAYDCKGRLKRLRTPYDPDYTVKYEYWDHHTEQKSNLYHKWAKTSYYNPGYPHDLQVEIHTDGLARVLRVLKTTWVDGMLMNAVSGVNDYDALGRVSKAYEAVAMDTSYVYDYRFYYEIVKELNYTAYTYDNYDRVTSVSYPDAAVEYTGYDIAPDGMGQTRFRNSFIDANGNSVYSYTGPRGLQTIFAHANGRTNFYYDGWGRLLETADPDDNITQYEYDIFGRLVRQKHPARGKTRREYDGYTNNVAVEYNSLGEIHYKYDYDFLVEQTHFRYENTDIDYDCDPEEAAENGEKCEDILPDILIYGDETVRFEYGKPDGEDIIYPNGEHREYNTYNNGRLIKVQDNTGVSELDYGPFGEVVTEKRMYLLPGNEYLTFKTGWEYDALGRTRKIIYPDGEVLSYNYDPAGRLNQLRGLTVLGDDTWYVRDIQYNVFGKRTSIYYENGIQEEYTYDPLRHRLEEIRSDQITYNYRYDPVGNIIQKTDRYYHLGKTIEHYYDYDNVNQLSLAQGVSSGYGLEYETAIDYYGNGRINNKYAYGCRTDYSGRHFFETGGHYSYESMDPDRPVTNPYAVQSVSGASQLAFRWDKNGNLKYKEEDGGWETNYFWTPLNRMDGFSSGDNSGLYLYDAGGERTLSLISYPIDIWQNGQWERMDIADRAKLYAGPLVTLDERGYTRHYFIEGRRVGGAIGGRGEFTMDTDKYLYPINDNMERNFESYISHYISYWEGESLNGLPLQSATDGEAHIVFVYHSDHLGSGTAISSEGAIIHHTLSYLPFGETLMDIKDPYQTPYDLSTSYQFTGHEKDEETGLTYAHARYYDSELAIWLSVDPLAEKYPWISSYAYCANNPVNYIDPTGLSHSEFDESGNYLRTTKDNWFHNTFFGRKGRIIDGNGNVTQKFKFADPKSDVQHLKEGKIYRVQFVQESEIISMLSKAGAFSKENKTANSHSRYGYILEEGKGHGKFDFAANMSGGIPSHYSDVSQSLFLVDGVAHNHFNYGNFLFGAAGRALGLTLLELKAGAHYNSLFNSETNAYESQLDSRDDQFSIRMGVKYANKHGYKNMYYRVIVGPF